MHYQCCRINHIKHHQTDTPFSPPLSIIAVFLSSRRCPIPQSLNQLVLTRGEAVAVKTVKGEDDIKEVYWITDIYHLSTAYIIS